MYLCARGIDFLSTILIFDFGIVQTVVFICFSCYLFFIVRSFVISFDFIVFVLLNLIGIEHR